MKRTALVLAACCLSLAACGGEDVAAESAEDSTASTTSSSSARPSTTTPRPSPTPARTTQTMSPEAEASFVASVTSQTVTENRDALSTQLVKSNGLIEAQTDFRFDETARTLVLAVTSVFNGADYSAGLAYELATDFAPVFWGPEVDSVSPESLVLFSITVDGQAFVCDGPTMAALADRELSEEMFFERCSG